MRCVLTALVLSLMLAGCHLRHGPSAPAGPLTTVASSTPPPMAITLAPQINATDFLREERQFASAPFGGRKPGTRGEVLTTHYLVSVLKRMGLSPGEHGAWLQPVPMVSIERRNVADPLRVTVPAGTLSFAPGSDVVAVAQQARAHIDLDHAPFVFLGYGIDAPALQWNDYQGIDVRGKIVIVLANLPGSGAERFSRQGLAREKFAQAARHGAAACFIVHAPAAAYSWRALRNRYAGAVQALPESVTHTPRLAVAGWLSHAAAEALFSAAGASLDTLSHSAAEPGFEAVPLAARGSIRIDSTVRYGWSDNVLALLRGTRHPDEVVIYSAHWDGLGVIEGAHGRLETLPGAIDNGSGLAAVLEIADAFAHRKHPPRRSVLFLMPTLGAAGQAGLRYYVAHPAFPMARTVADIDVNAWPILGRARDMTVFGTARSTLAADLAGLLALQGRTLTRNPPADIALFYRADRYSFARAGVPTLLAGPGLDLLSGARAAGQLRWRAYLRQRADTPRDTVDANWDLSGTLEDVETLYLLGRDLADGSQWPRWASGTPYRWQRRAAPAAPPHARR